MGNSNAEGWRRQRRVANPVFHRAMPVQVFGEIVETIFRTIDEKETLHAVDIADYMKRYSKGDFRCVCKQALTRVVICIDMRWIALVLVSL